MLAPLTSWPGSSFQAIQMSSSRCQLITRYRACVPIEERRGKGLTIISVEIVLRPLISKLLIVLCSYVCFHLCGRSYVVWETISLSSGRNDLLAGSCLAETCRETTCCKYRRCSSLRWPRLTWKVVPPRYQCRMRRTWKDGCLSGPTTSKDTRNGGSYCPTECCLTTGKCHTSPVLLHSYCCSCMLGAVLL